MGPLRAGLDFRLAMLGEFTASQAGNPNALQSGEEAGDRIDAAAIRVTLIGPIASGGV